MAAHAHTHWASLDGNLVPSSTGYKLPCTIGKDQQAWTRRCKQQQLAWTRTWCCTNGCSTCRMHRGQPQHLTEKIRVRRLELVQVPLSYGVARYLARAVAPQHRVTLPGVEADSGKNGKEREKEKIRCWWRRRYRRPIGQSITCGEPPPAVTPCWMTSAPGTVGCSHYPMSYLSASNRGSGTDPAVSKWQLEGATGRSGRSRLENFSIQEFFNSAHLTASPSSRGFPLPNLNFQRLCLCLCLAHCVSLWVVSPASESRWCGPRAPLHLAGFGLVVAANSNVVPLPGGRLRHVYRNIVLIFP